jgi:LTXXQ motif family protein
MRTFSRLVLTVSLAIALAGSASAQRQPGGQGQGRGGFGGGGIGGLIRIEAVQKELKMEKEQVEKATAAIKTVTDKHADEFAKLRDLPADERRTKSQEINKVVNDETTKAVGEVLKPEQMTRLKQLELQRAGFAAYSRADVQTALKFTDEQKEKVKTIADEANKQIRELMPMGTAGGARPARGAGGAGAGARGGPNAEKMTAIRKETTEKIVAVLTDDQKKSWKEMTGEAFTFPPPTFGRPATPKKDD